MHAGAVADAAAQVDTLTLVVAQADGYRGRIHVQTELPVIQGHLRIQVDVEFAAFHDQFPTSGPQQFNGLHKGQMGEFVSQGSHSAPPIMIESVWPSIPFYPSICNVSGLDGIYFDKRPGRAYALI